jgi:hypothetical protein
MPRVGLRFRLCAIFVVDCGECYLWVESALGFDAVFFVNYACISICLGFVIVGWVGARHCPRFGRIFGYAFSTAWGFSGFPCSIFASEK